MRRIYTFLGLSLLLCVCGGGRAQQMTLEECDARFREHLEQLKTQHREKVEDLQKTYLAALLRFESSARSGGNLQDVQAAREEIQRVEQEEDGREIVPSDHARIQEMQEIRARKLKSFAEERARGVLALVESVRTFAQNTSRELTRSNEIDKAVKWDDWLNQLDAEPDVAVALRTLERRQAQQQRAASGANRAGNFHPALRGTPVKLIAHETLDFPEGARAYVAGNEPRGNEKRMGTVSTPSASGIGNAHLMGTPKLIDEDNTLSSSRSRWSNYKHNAHLYMPRLEVSPIAGKSLGRSLVVFDLFKRGSGSRREVIRTDTLLLPPIEAGQKVVVDARPYEYETTRYRSSISNYRYDSATADEFYGYIVSLFDENGDMIYQRSTERALNSYARETPPR